ncbi:GAF domain-containing sensor histidine kinase [Iamia sp. SCSIO 61187]|uniref:GAF domain-containing sensor histidine kinase n=1 Tax=Iamia sp. SCSIO 61187 TaxID=2722752 RepID=UPI001C639A04|nr:GAF domain-containing sensor histidine kinase [Iamia sp. SCSIO 61187]QYG93505.1 GAF domain-containing sensor histidine kinase [Iamia sp. SCSIO 61187]
MTRPTFGLHAGPAALRRLLDAVLSVGSELDLPSVLQRIIEAATELVDARYGALGVLDDEGLRLSQFITVGVDDETRAAIGPLPKGHGILGLLITDPRPIRLPNLSEHPDSYGFPPNHPPMTSFLGVPIHIRGEVFGNLYLCDRQGDEVFSDVDEEMAVALAAAAGIAIDQARLHARVGEISMMADRDRIARDLHDRVIQRLFAIGLSLEGISRSDLPPAITERLHRAVDDLDETVRQVRSSIFELEERRLPGRSLRQEILAVCADAGRGLGYEPVVRFAGPVDSGVEPGIADHLLAVIREALSNVARHAQAHEVEVGVTVRDGRLDLSVVDDGRGIDPAAPRGDGLRNMEGRATQLGGGCTIEPGRPTGTRIHWTVPTS